MKKAIIAAVAAALVLSLAACGESSDAQESKAETTTTTAAENKEAENTDGEDKGDADSEAENAAETEAPAETESAAETEAPAEDGKEVFNAGNFTFEFDNNDWIVTRNEGVGCKLSHVVNDEQAENYSYQVVINVETGYDYDTVKQGVLSLYEGNAVLGDPTDEELNGMPVERIHGELNGDGSAAMADIDLLFCQPEGEEGTLVVRFTKVSIDGSSFEAAEEDINELLASISHN